LVLLNIVNEKVLAPETRLDGLSVHIFSFTFVILLLCFFGVKQKPVFHFRQSLSVKNKRNATQEHNDTNDSDTHKSDEPIKTSTFVETNIVQDHKETNDLGVSPELISSVVERMGAYMRSEKPYTDPDFSVYSLAEALNVPRRVLSVVLNSGLSKNFYLYVNEFRIEEVKALLASEENNQSTILDIAYQSGFKSKSSFNSLFKQHCALTPSQYRKMAKIG
jgi:AraC-like DNA-binding protein